VNVNSLKQAPVASANVEKPATQESKIRQPTGVDRQNIDPQMIEAAQGMEAMFINEMTKAMRKTVESSEFSLNNSASDMYQSMLDGEHAEIAARANEMGLSNLIIDYWTRQDYTKNRE
jgi:Rod binding domain-containing protein